MESALIAKLLASAGVTALVSTRINWKERPQGSALPAIVLHKPSRLPDYHHAGPSGLVSTRVQVNCLATSYGASVAIARAVEVAVCGYSFTQGATRFDLIKPDGERDDNDTNSPLGSIKIIMLDLIVQSANAS